MRHEIGEYVRLEGGVWRVTGIKTYNYGADCMLSLRRVGTGQQRYSVDPDAVVSTRLRLVPKGFIVIDGTRATA